MLTNLPKRMLNKLKDINISNNIVDFIGKYSYKSIPKRETIFKPEILIPCYNHGIFLEEAVENIPKNIPITIINDKSTDNTLKIIKDLQKKYKFKLINNKKNLNQVGSLNKAIKLSKNNLFIILNADDVLLKYHPNTMINLFKTNSTIRLAGAGGIPFSHPSTLIFNKYLPLSAKHKLSTTFFPKEKSIYYNHPNSLNMAMSGCTFLKSAWEFVDGFFEFKDRVVSFDDRDFQMRINAFFDVLVINEPLSLYRQGSSTKRSQNV